DRRPNRDDLLLFLSSFYFRRRQCVPSRLNGLFVIGPLFATPFVLQNMVRPLRCEIADLVISKTALPQFLLHGGGNHEGDARLFSAHTKPPFWLERKSGPQSRPTGSLSLISRAWHVRSDALLSPSHPIRGERVILSNHSRPPHPHHHF